MPELTKREIAEMRSAELVHALWDRLDRVHNDYLSKQELDCEDFHNVIRAAVTNPSKNIGAVVGGAAYSRAVLNMKEAVNLCIRKVDANSDGTWGQVKVF
jgi:hypothetical protein